MRTIKKILLLNLTILSLICFGQVKQNVSKKITTGVASKVVKDRKPHPISLHFGLGSCSYYGQMSGSKYIFKAINFQVNAGAKYRLNSRFCVGGNLRYASLSASDKNTDSPLSDGGSGRYERNLSFKTNMIGLEAFGTFDIIAFTRNHIVEGEIVGGGGIFGVSPYLIGGIGLMYYNPTAEVGGKTYSLRDVKTSLEKQNGFTYGSFTPTFTYGIGARVQLTRLLDLGIEGTFTNTLTDYLDDLGSQTHYPDRTKPGITQLDLALADRYPEQGLKERSSTDLRANTNGKILDSYFMLNFKIEYTIPSKLDIKEGQKLKTGHKHIKKGKGSKHHKFDKR